MTTPPPSASVLAQRLAADLKEEFEERAAVFEFEANQPRELAECLALLQILDRHPLALMRLRVYRLRVGEGVEAIALSDASDAGSSRISGMVATELSHDALAEAIRNRFGGLALLYPLTL
jgi:hypothetical protein